MLQQEHPDPPVAEIHRWRLSIQWSRIFSRVLVSNYLISRPNLHITLPQATEELLENVPLQERGWREAVYLFDPLKINELKIEDADGTYVDQEPSKPLHLPHLNLLAGDIRNLRSPDDTYPSNLNLDAHIFGSGRVEMKERANFLAEPHAWSPCPSHLAAGALEPLLPVTGRYNVEVYGGVISAQGQLEYTAKGATEASLNSLMIEDARVDFAPPGKGAGKTGSAHATVGTAQARENIPGMRIRIDRGEHEWRIRVSQRRHSLELRLTRQNRKHTDAGNEQSAAGVWKF